MAAKDKDKAKETVSGEEADFEPGKVYNQFEAMSKIVALQKVMDKAAQDQGMYFTAMSGEVMRRGSISTGSLALDLVMGGGHQPGRFTYFYGPTGSGKSTILYQSILDPLDRNLPVNFLDYEASTDPEYLEKLGIDLAVLGQRNKKGEWIVEPRLRYTQPNTVEEGFGYLRNLLIALPDKIMMMDDEEPRFFVVATDYQYQLTWRSINEGLKKKKVYEVEDGSPQLVVMLDSFNAATPKAADVRYGEGQDVGLLAKALSQGLQLTKSLLGKKMVNLIGVNALKINPMARMQNPETEPGGTAMQLYPDVKIKVVTSRSQSSVVEEAHLSGTGIDRYLTGMATVIKNKGGSAFRKMPYRIWHDELGEPKGGFDPVFDLFQNINSFALVTGRSG